MGFTVQYCRVFIRSGCGITPLVLMGDNNSYDVGYPKRRERRWCCYHDYLGASENELKQYAADVAKAPDLTIWYHKGREFSGADLPRWMKQGIEAADTLEHILQYNGLRNVFCYIYYQNGEDICELEQHCSTTEEFDSWIVQAKAKINSGEQHYYPVVEFGVENIRLRPPILASGKPLIIRRGHDDYVTKVEYAEDGRVTGLVFIQDIKKALRFENGNSVPDLHAFRGLQYIYAEQQDKPYNVLLKITSGRNIGFFVGRRFRSKIRVETQPYAKRYADLESALKAKADIESKFAFACEPYILDETEH